jgi:hypothetical protein
MLPYGMPPPLIPMGPMPMVPVGPPPMGYPFGPPPPPFPMEPFPGPPGMPFPSPRGFPPAQSVPMGRAGSGGMEPITKFFLDPATQQFLPSPRLARIDPQPFAKGTYRRVHHMTDETGRRFVAKALIHASGADPVFREVTMQSLCATFAEAFNAHNPPRPISVLPAFAIRRANGQFMLVEELLPGSFAKYNNNGGWVARQNNNVAHAFSHFTYNYTGGELMVVDVQGVGDIFTDLQLHSQRKGQFGPGDLGPQGMKMFFASHRCNPVCQSMALGSFDGMPPMGLQPLGPPPMMMAQPPPFGTPRAPTYLGPPGPMLMPPPLVPIGPYPGPMMIPMA